MSSSTTRRVVAGAALSLPLTLAVSGVASATESYGGHDHGGPGCGQRAAQAGGGLLDLLAQVNPALNVGGILNSGPVQQAAVAQSSANSGIQQYGGFCGGGQESFQAGDLVAGLLQVDPAANIGGVLSSGPVTQVAAAGSSANSGIQQYGGGHGAAHDRGDDDCDGAHQSGGHQSGGHQSGGHRHDGGHRGGHDGDRGGKGGGDQSASQQRSLIDLPVQVNPALNVGGIANSGPVEQVAVADSDQNSGIQQYGGGHGGRHGGDQRASQGGGLLGLGLQVNPSINLGGILSGGPVSQAAAATGDSNSGITQYR